METLSRALEWNISLVRNRTIVVSNRTFFVCLGSISRVFELDPVQSNIPICAQNGASRYLLHLISAKHQIGDLISQVINTVHGAFDWLIKKLGSTSYGKHRTEWSLIWCRVAIRVTENNHTVLEKSYFR